MVGQLKKNTHKQSFHWSLRQNQMFQTPWNLKSMGKFSPCQLEKHLRLFSQDNSIWHHLFFCWPKFPPKKSPFIHPSWKLSSHLSGSKPDSPTVPTLNFKMSISVTGLPSRCSSHKVPTVARVSTRGRGLTVFGRFWGWKMSPLVSRRQLRFYLSF